MGKRVVSSLARNQRDKAKSATGYYSLYYQYGEEVSQLRLSLFEQKPYSDFFDIGKGKRLYTVQCLWAPALETH
jgi:hypothetical protein